MVVELGSCSNLFVALYSNVSPLVALWKEDLQAQGKRKAAEALADPAEYENLFPDLKYALQAEERYKSVRERGARATEYLKLKDSLDWDLIQAVKENPGQTNGTSQAEPEDDLLGMEEEQAEAPEDVQDTKASPASAKSDSSDRKPNGFQVGNSFVRLALEITRLCFSISISGSAAELDISDNIGDLGFSEPTRGRVCGFLAPRDLHLAGVIFWRSGKPFCSWRRRRHRRL
jgi:hypothetical protein